MKITVVGGGGTGAAIASDMIAAGHDVTMYEQETCKGCLPDIEAAGVIRRIGNGPQGEVPAPKITYDPAEAFANAEVVFIAIIACRHREVCKEIVPHLQDGQIVCFLSGNCGSVTLKQMLPGRDILVGETVASYTTTRYRGDATVYYASPVPAPKPVVAFPAKDSKEFTRILNGCYSSICYPDTPVRYAFEAALNSPNVTCHLLGTILNVSAMEKSLDFRLYRDGLTPSVLKAMFAMGKEREQVIEKFGWVGNLYDAVGVINACANFDEKPLPHLAGFRLSTGPSSTKHRYLTEDAYSCGPILSSLGKVCGVPTPATDAGVALASILNDIDYQEEGITLKNYGLEGCTVEQINHYLETGELSK